MSSIAKDLHIDKMLTNVAINYRPEGMIAPFIAPIVSVDKQSNLYPVFSRADALRREDTKRSPGAEANKISRSVSSESYFCENYALSYPVPIEDRANADPIMLTEMINGRVRYTVDKIDLDWEVRVATQVNNTANVGSSTAVASSWTDHTNSDPLTDLQTAIDNIKDSTGKKPNKVVMSELAWRHVKRNTTIRDLIKGNNNGGGYASVEQLKALLEVDEVLIGGAYYNTANEAQSESLSQVWDDNVLISYTAPRPSIEVPSFMYSFRWRANGIANMQVERHPYNTRTKSEDIETGYYQAEKITGADYSFLITAVTSST